MWLQGSVKPALGRLRDGLATRARELSQELLALQEKRDAGLDAITERTEDNAALETMVRATGCNPGWKVVGLLQGAAQPTITCQAFWLRGGHRITPYNLCTSLLQPPQVPRGHIAP